MSLTCYILELFSYLDVFLTGKGWSFWCLDPIFSHQQKITLNYTGKGLSPRPPYTSDTSHKSLWFWLTGYKLEIPMTPSSSGYQWQVYVFTYSSYQLAINQRFPQPLLWAQLMTVWITVNCGKFWKRWEYQTTWPASWEICMQVRKQQLELDMEQQTGSK